MESLYECITIDGLYGTICDRLELKDWPQLVAISQSSNKKLELRLPYLEKLEM